MEMWCHSGCLNGREVSQLGEREVGLLVIRHLWDNCALKPKGMELDPQGKSPSYQREQELSFGHRL